MHVRYCLPMLLIACVDQAEPLEVSTKVIRHSDAITDRYIVVLDHAYDLDKLAARHNAKVKHRYSAALNGFSAEMTAAEANALAGDPGVLFVEQDTPVYASATQANPTYGLDRIDQPNLPLDSTYNYATDGAGVTVFVIDTGLNTTHVEFTGRVRTDLARTAIDDGQGFEDCNGHGTHVAGTVAGSVYGVAKKASIVPIRVLDCEGSGSSSGVIAGMDYVAQNHPPRSVVNMSLGGPAGDAKDAAVRNLVASGVTVVVAAGNENTDACNSSPAREPMAITVGSTTNTDARSSFSNFGTCVDVFAPGSNITSAWIDSPTAVDTISGTSMASPHVAGVAALYLALNPNATPAQVTAAILGSAVANKVTDPKGSPNKLLQSSFSAAPPQPPPGGTAKITSPANGAQVGSTFEVLADAAGAVSVELQFDGMKLVVDQMAPFAFTVSNAPEGMHRVSVIATDAAGKVATNEIMVNVIPLGLGGGGNNPVPPPTRRDDGGGCSTAGGSGFGVLLLVLAMARSRRRRR